MQLFFTPSVIQDYRALPNHLQKLTDKQLHLFLTDPRHPSLQIKMMQDPRNIWEGRISRGYRFTFQMQGDKYILRRLGKHDILKKP